MAQRDTKAILTDLGGEAQTYEIVKRGREKGIWDPLFQSQGLVNRDLHRMLKWGEIEQVSRGRYRLVKEEISE